MEQSVLEEEASRSTDKLCVLERNLTREIKDVRALEQKLSPIVAEALSRIRFPELVATTMERVLSFFEQLVAQYSPEGDICTEHIEERVEQLRRNYTMADEREIHNQALGQGTGRIEKAEPVLSNAGSLPENVELF